MALTPALVDDAGSQSGAARDVGDGSAAKSRAHGDIEPAHRRDSNIMEANVSDRNVSNFGGSVMARRTGAAVCFEPPIRSLATLEGDHPTVV